MSRPFCSTPLWDVELTWDAQVPDFTSCFENTVLVYVPNVFLILISPLYLYYLLKWQVQIVALPLTRLGAFRTIWSLLLSFLCLMNFFRTVSEEISGFEPEISLFIGPLVQVLTLLWTVALMQFERKHGVINSGPLFIYWLLTAICGLPQLYSYALQPAQNDVYRVAVDSICYAVVLLQLIASCLIDAVPATLLNDKNRSPELTASFLSQLTFHWINKLCWTGFKKTLTQEDVFKLNPRDASTTVVPQLEEAWQIQVSKSKKLKTQIAQPQGYGATSTVTISVDADKNKPSLLKALFSAFGLKLLAGSCCKIFYDISQFVAPLILQSMIDFTNNVDEPVWHGYVYALAIFVANLFGTTLFHQAIYIVMTTGMTIKAALTSIIYKKALLMTSAAKKESTVGEIVNLMSVDVDRIQNIAGYLHVLWSAPFQIIVAMVLLFNAMGTSTLAGIAVMVALIPLNGIMARFIIRYQTEQMKCKDKRIKVLTEIFSGIKILKLYAWEPSFHERVTQIREDELILLKKAAFMNALLNFTWISAPYLVMLATFVTFIYTSGEPLTPDRAFVALSLFNILRTPLSMLPEIMAYTAQSLVSIKRIGKFLGHEDLDPSNVERAHNSKTKTAFEVQGGTFSWGADEQPSVHDINLKIGRGKLVAIVGPVGSGKSSLLSALLGDMDKVKGHVSQNGTLSYVAQQAWIQNATIKDNILFGKDFNQNQYDQVLEACALKSDLQILTDGDQTEIGEKGINLSGGQKQRVSLARAVYQDRDIILLDDPLSAVDAHVGKHIFESVIGPKGVLKNKTRILVTHGLHWLPHCDEIVVMADGRITDQGKFQELLTRGGTFADFIREYLTEAGGVDALMSEELSETAVQLLRQISIDSNDLPPRTPTTPGAANRFSVTSHKASISESVSQRRRSSLHDSQRSRASRKSSVKKPPVPAKLIEEETKGIGGIPWPVMKAYLNALGLLLFALWLGFYLVSQGFGIFGNIWLTQWTSDELLMNVSIANTSDYINRQNLYLGLYGMAAAGQAVFMLIHSIFFALSSVKASRSIHSNMLDCILHCAMSFFDTTPTGRILNRFSKDCDTVDNNLPLTLWFWLSMVIQVLTTVFIIIYGFPLFAAFVVPLGVFYYFVQRFYIPTTRQLKRIESVTRSPIYNHFSETLTGVSTIRAFGDQNRFIDESLKRVDINNMSYFASNTSNRWLGFRLELIGNLTVFATSMLAIFYRGTANSSIVGLSISYSLQITAALTWLVRMSSDLESNFVSVERLDEYSRLPGEASWQLEPKPDSSWPQKGEIVFDQYATRYRPGLQLVLNGISCQIRPGEKIGIVGRTGAGKSSLTLALFRLIESAGGRIVIDGLDISKLGLHQLRSKLTILPQDPVVFSGSVRHNIDPFSRHSDDQLWKALDNAGLRDFVSSTEKALEHECGENGESLSVGQRQLLCLARALLNKTKVLVLDEATAAVDVETDEQIMKTIRTEFSDCTVLIIAHRLNTVMDSDRVLVLDKGQIAEFDSPQTLLADSKSMFASMAESAKALGGNNELIEDVE